MRKRLLLLLFVVFLGKTALAAPVSVDMAKQVAANWMNEKTGQPSSPADVSEIHTVRQGSAPVYHVFEFDSGGWVIIPADDIAYPVIGYSPDGTYAAEHHSPAFREWMDNAGQDIAAAKTKRVSPPSATRSAWDRLSVPTEAFIPAGSRTRSEPQPPVKGPLIQTNWSQGQYYNTLCPADSAGPDGHAVTGCVATAMAQIMRYHSHPTTGFGANSYTPDKHPEYGVQSADFGATTYNWANMPDTGAVTAYNNDVATLLYHCGVSVSIDYGNGVTDSGSSGSSVDAKDALRDHFKYDESVYYAQKSGYADDTWKNMLKAEINENRPLLYSGSGTGGHAFICDGYDSSTPAMFHFNWGWNDGSDGYFLLSSLTPCGDNFTNDQDGIFGIQPAKVPDLTFPYWEGFESGPISEDWMVSGQHVTVSAAEAHSGSGSLLLNDPDTTDTGINSAILKINVPAAGAALSFRVKRKSDAASDWLQQTALIRAQFGTETLLTIFDGDFDDDEWQRYVVDLSPWKNTVVRLYFEQKRQSTPSNQWMYIDDVEITEKPIADFKTERTEWFVNRPLKFTNLSANANSHTWTFTGGTPQSSTEVDPTITYTSPGTYPVSLVSTNTNGSDTETKTGYITIYPEPAVPYTNNFNSDNGRFYPYILTGCCSQWEWGTCNSSNFKNDTATIEGSGSWATVLNEYHGFNTRYALESPPFSLACETGDYFLEFSFRSVCGTGAGMNLEYSTDGGTTWLVLGDKNDPNGNGWYDEFSVGGLDGKPGWKNQAAFTVFYPKYKINQLKGNSDVRFRFVFGALNSFNDGFQIDEFSITNINFPYTEGFENNLPDNWTFSGERVTISTAEAHSGSGSLLLNDPTSTGYNVNTAALDIWVPENGHLSFWVKRGFDPAESQYNQQKAMIKSGEDVVKAVFDGDFNDSSWQQFTIDLAQWENQFITLYFEQYNSCNYKQWMYIDDVEITSSLPDLVIQSPGADPAATTAGSSLSVSCAVKNQGTAPASASTLKYYLSADAAFDVGDILMGSDSVGALPPGQTGVQGTSFSLPVSATPGTWYILFVADADNALGEGNENNNVAQCDIEITSSLPDLIIQSPGADPAATTASSSLSVLCAVKNQGTAPASASTLKYYLSADAAFDSGDILMGSDAVGTLSPGQTSSQDASFSLPACAMPGTWYVLFVADADNAVSEGNENNNVASYQITVDDPSPAAGDIDGSGGIDLSDAILVLRLMADIPVNADINTGADVNADHKIGMEEAVYILQEIAGLR
ncbi:hypothetical protein DENIS_0430 [Desulfonema ishimotonii]|uniref:PKD domain-containing protein n=1 Tax=Desulfonema ishimotonii TaxID=45657 RepID=A0A401FRA2_9BACT|nr:C10 family peptidase [Desulfonema ishimotonii]GBC59491.1 hypothetical protein DENIS_0430 [Desulfonema ishimotonii]